MTQGTLTIAGHKFVRSLRGQRSLRYNGNQAYCIDMFFFVWMFYGDLKKRVSNCLPNDEITMVSDVTIP